MTAASAKLPWLLPLLLAVPAPARAETIKVTAPSYWCPFSCTANAPEEGFTIDILRAIFTPDGDKIEYINMNYARALNEVRLGHMQAISSAFKEEAPGFVFPNLPIALDKYCVYTTPGTTWQYTGPASFGNMRVGVIKGYSYGPEIDAYIKQNPANFEVHGGDDLTEKIARKVMLGRLDALIEDTNLVQYLLARKPAVKLQESGCAHETYVYLALSPALQDAPALAKKFDEGMVKLHRSGALEQIMRKYGQHDWLGRYLENRPKPGAAK